MVREDSSSSQDDWRAMPGLDVYGLDYGNNPGSPACSAIVAGCHVCWPYGILPLRNTAGGDGFWDLVQTGIDNAGRGVVVVCPLAFLLAARWKDQ
jgi:hypothetical protein